VQAELRIVDLFCGCGGFSLGAQAAGLSPQLAFDIDPILTSSFSFNHPDAKLVLSDLSKVSGLDVERQLGGRVDGVFGGPPCQAFSDMGHRRTDDPRRSLLGDFFRLVNELKPAFFLMENVRGLVYADARPVLDRALHSLSGKYVILGPIILDAADFGAATRRPRLFVLGYDPARFDKLTTGDVEAAKREPATVRSAMNDLSSATMIGEQDGFDLWRTHHAGRPSNYAAKLRSSDRTFTGHRRTAHSREVIARFKRVAPGEKDAVGRHPRLDWDGQCPTLRAGTGSERGSFQSVRPIHPDEPRVITVREGARLQGFPDAFRFHSTIWHSFRMIGNSVSPIVAEALFSLIASRIERHAPNRVAAE
jgi:DNA (cytosine-5)-methyltransferase 1